MLNMARSQIPLVPCDAMNMSNHTLYLPVVFKRPVMRSRPFTSDVAHAWDYSLKICQCAWIHEPGICMQEGCPPKR